MLRIDRRFERMCWASVMPEIERDCGSLRTMIKVVRSSDEERHSSIIERRDGHGDRAREKTAADQSQKPIGLVLIQGSSNYAVLFKCFMSAEVPCGRRTYVASFIQSLIIHFPIPANMYKNKSGPTRFSSLLLCE